MGGAQGTAMCCGSGDGCCAKDGKNCGDIVRAKPMHYPGLDGAEGRERKDKAGQAAKQSGRASPSNSRDCDAGSKQPAATGQREAEEVYDDGSNYVGQLSNGLRHGCGVWTSDSEQYSGQWKDDQRDGQGRQTWQDGRVYEGQFRKGKFHGFGRMEWHIANGIMVYEGQYVDDLKEGKGRYIWPDNRMYDGEWRGGQRCGEAVYTNSLGQKRPGIWKDDRVERWLDDDLPTS